MKSTGWSVTCVEPQWECNVCQLYWSIGDGSYSKCLLTCVPFWYDAMQCVSTGCVEMIRLRSTVPCMGKHNQ